jgi:DNA-binding protein WhiA
LHISGSIRLSGGGGFALSAGFESAGVARRVIKLLKASYNLDAEIRVEQVERLGKHHRYLLILPNQLRLTEMIYELGMLTRENQIESTVKSELVKKGCCRASFLRGAFLAGGSISDPQKKTYHLEIVAYSEEFANGLVYLMNLVSIKAKLGKRKDKYLVYLKDSEAIGRFLSLINAHQGVIKLEEVRVIKGLRGDVNRIVNCETANLEKSLSTAWKQVELINELIRLNVFQELPPNLRTTAELRLEYPEASLKELGEAHLPPISKSAVNHRLREIMHCVEKFTEEAGN